MNRILAIIGIVGTILYFVALALLLDVRLAALRTIELNQLGDFLAGVFGPLAVLWLVLGFFQQGIELRQNSRILALQADELKNSVEQQRELVAVTREQASAQMEGIRFEREQAAAAARPHFVSQGVGHTGSSGRATYKLRVQNVGNTATRVLLTCEPPMAMLSPEQMPLWATGGNGEIRFEYVEGVATHPAVLKIHYVDAAGKPGSQVFRLEVVPTGPYPSVLAKHEA